jgi:hypothetical protein
MWGAQRFHGPAPGQQTGSLGWDDCRNPRLPLPALPGVGGVTSPAGCGTSPWFDPHFSLPTPNLPHGGGGGPLLSNPGNLEAMFERGYAQYVMKSAMLQAAHEHLSTTVGKNHNVMPWETVITDTGVSTTVPNTGGDGGGGNGNTTSDETEKGQDTLWEKAKTFLSGVWNGVCEAWDSPAGMAAGIVTGVVVGGLALASAPITLPVLAGAAVSAAAAAFVANMVVGGGDVLVGALIGKSSKDYVSPGVHQRLRIARDTIQVLGLAGELTFAAGGAALKLARWGSSGEAGANFTNWWNKAGGKKYNFGLRKFAWQFHAPKEIPSNWNLSLANTGKGIVASYPGDWQYSYRFMDPRMKPFPYPNGYYKITDAGGRTLNVLGDIVDKDTAAAHISSWIPLNWIKYPWKHLK